MDKNLTYIPILNILRGIAALLVVLFHFVITTTGYIKDDILRSIFSAYIFYRYVEKPSKQLSSSTHYGNNIKG